MFGMTEMVLHLESGRKLPKHLRHEEIPRHIFTPRTYQVQLLDFALRQNSILCVGNEESKAFLIVMLIKEIMFDVRAQRADKHIIIIINEIDAGCELAKIILQHIDVNLRVYDGNTIQDVHSVSEQHILVFKAELFLEILKAGLIHLSRVDLLIFDECHNSTSADHPNAQIMKLYGELDAKRPKILALTTTFLTDKLQSCTELEAKINELEETFQATAETANLVMGDRYGSPPQQKITFCQSHMSDSSTSLDEQIIHILLSALMFLDDFQENTASGDDVDPCNVPKRALIVCWDILDELGSWCAAAAARALIKQLEKIMSHEKNDVVKTLLLMTATQLLHISELFDDAFKDVATVEEFMDFVSPKVVELLHVLRQYKPDEDFMIISGNNSADDFSDSDMSDDMSDMSDDNNRRHKLIHVAVKKSDASYSSQEDLFESDNGRKLCALVFVDKRNAAQFLFKLIDEICAWDETLFFVKSRYIVGSRGKTGVREGAVVKKEEDILKKFRMQDLNLLVCTNILEEGVDIPRCNLVVKFNPPSSYRSYTLSKSRARASRSQFIMLVDENERETFEKKLSDYMAIQEVLKARCHNPDLTCDQSNDDSDGDSLPPYVPSNNDKACVTLNTAIAHVNRYCAKLPSDSFTHLTPICHVETTQGDDGVTRYTAHLRLPINSTVKQEIVGPAMCSRRTAQKAVALKTCGILHKEGELDDNLLPVGKEVFRYEDDDEVDDEDSEGQARAGTAKRKRYYFKQVPRVLVNSHPSANVPCILYDLDYKLTGPITEEQNSRGRQIYAPEDSLRGFGLLMAHSIPQVPRFPIYTRSGEVTISINVVDSAVCLSRDGLDQLHKFHKFVFSNVLRLQKDPMDYHPYETDISYIIVPVTKESSPTRPVIDWDFITKVETSVSQTGKNKYAQINKPFIFDTDLFKDAVVMPSYRNVDQPQYFYVAEIRYDLSPISPFPSPDLYETFEKYYETKYGLTISHCDQPLLDVDHTSARLNLLTPRYMNQKGMVLPTCSLDTKRARRENLQQKQILIPELCDIHVFPASLWRKAVCLPAILYRMTSLLIAEEMRVKVAKETKIGRETLDDDFIFPPLDFGFETCPEKLPSPGPVMRDGDGTSSGNTDGPNSRDSYGPSPQNRDIPGSEKSYEHSSQNDATPYISNGLDSQCLHGPSPLNNDRPHAQIIDGPSPQNNDGPHALNIDGPSPQNNDGPHALNIDGPSPQNNNGPHALNIDGPSPKINNGPDAQNIDGPSPQNIDGPHALNIDGPSPKINNGPDAQHIDGPSPQNIDGPSPQNSNGFASHTNEFDSNKFMHPSIILPSIQHDKQCDLDSSRFRDDGSVFDAQTICGSIGENARYEFTVQNGLDKVAAIEKAASSKTINCDTILKPTAERAGCSCFSSELIINSQCDTNSSNETSTLHHKCYNCNDSAESSQNMKKNPNDKTKNFCVNGAHIDTLSSTSSSCAVADTAVRTLPSCGTSNMEATCALNNAEKAAILSNQLINHDTFTDVADPGISSDVTQQGVNSNKFEAINNVDCQAMTKESHLSKKFANAPKTCTERQKPLVVFDSDTNLGEYIGPSPCSILQAITMSNANDFFSLERLETIGDSYLKYAITVYLYCTYPGIHEGKLSYLRSKQVSNYNLYRLGKRKGFPEAMISSKFEPSENWLLPGYNIDESQWKGTVPKVTISATTETTLKYIGSLSEAVIETQPIISKECKSSKTSKGGKNAGRNFDFDGVKPLNDFEISSWMGEEAESIAALAGSSISHSSEQYQQFRREFDDLAWVHEDGKANVMYSLRTQHCVPDKSVADCVEALLGCYLISGGNRVALLFMSWLGLKVLPRRNVNTQETTQIADQFDDLKLPPSPFNNHSPTDSHTLRRLLSGLSTFEATIGYTFNDKSYLLQAFTHASYYHNTVADCYQRLEFLGDAILDYVITRHLYEDSRKYSPGVLTDLRSALVNNNIFAALAVKWNFHKYFMTFSPALYHVINKFVAWQKENEDCISLDEDFSEGDQSAPEMEIPKALGDIFESVAGAIYLDSGMSLDTVWTVYYEMMKPLIQEYLESIPKSPVRELLEMEPETAQFEKPERTMEGKIRVTVNVVGKGEWTGVGRNYRIAKSAAAKKALKDIKKTVQSSGILS